MKLDIVLAGVGGQGVVSLGATIARAARREGLAVQFSEVHGMAQRGGSVLANLRIADSPIASALIPLGAADAIVATEPLEGLRYLDHLAPEGTLFTSTDPFTNIPDYPDQEKLLARLRSLPRVVLVEAGRLAKEAGTSKASNLVMVGAVSGILPIEPETIEAGVRKTFARKGEKIVDANIKAFRAGREAAACAPA